MVNKILANLSFSSSSAEQLNFYIKRLRREESVRKLGVFMLVMSMLVQLFAMNVPAEKSLAYSDNDILSGIRTKQDILKAWDRPGSDISKIYGKFGVKRDDIKNLSTKPNDTIRSNANNFWSIGRNSLTGYSNISGSDKNKEIAVRTDGPTVYLRPLRAWDSPGSYSNYAAFKGKNSTTGEAFWIIADCGNYTQIGKGQPPKPELQIKKSIVGKADKVKAGDTIKFRVEYRNKKQDSLAEDVVVTDKLQTDKFQVISNEKIGRDNTLERKIGNLQHTDNSRVFDFSVRVKKDLKPNTKICNTAKISASNANSATSSPVCVSVYTPCPYNPDIPSDGKGCKEPTAACKLTYGVLSQATREVRFNTKVSSTDSKKVKMQKYVYEFGDGTRQEHSSTKFSDERTHTYPVGKFNAQVTAFYTISGQAGKSKKASCTQQIQMYPPNTPPPEIPPSLSKEVTNITKNVSGQEALNTKVSAGDVLEYKLITTNSRDTEIKDFTVKDYVGDIIEYSDIDLAFLAKQGGTYDKATKSVVWDKQTLSSASDTVRKFRVTIKNPIPTTNTPSNVTTSFDCKISNEYGDEISMDVQCPMLKSVETLPNTGPGTAIGIAFVGTTISSYFFFRSRLLAKEMLIARKNYLIAGAP